MATISVKLDFSKFNEEIDKIIDSLKSNTEWLRPICVELVGLMHDRIHDKGLASDGSKIGQYSSGYLRRREANKLGNDSNIILVFSRKLSNSWTAFATEKGYAVGFTDDGASEGITARDKITFAEERFGKKILDLTDDENKYVNLRLVQIVEETLKPYANT